MVHLPSASLRRRKQGWQGNTPSLAAQRGTQMLSAAERTRMARLPLSQQPLPVGTGRQEMSVDARGPRHLEPQHQLRVAERRAPYLGWTLNRIPVLSGGQSTGALNPLPDNQQSKSVNPANHSERNDIWFHLQFPLLLSSSVFFFCFCCCFCPLWARCFQCSCEVKSLYEQQ